MKKLLRRLFCKHESNEVVCWHWVNSFMDDDAHFLEVQVKCNNCSKYHFQYIRGWDECCKFMSEHKDKQWSETCEPVL